MSAELPTCTPEQRAACPLSSHRIDQHHLAFPRRDHTKGIEKQWRNLPINKIRVCRGLHNAIHASGYLPNKPPLQDMALEIKAGTMTDRAIAEREYQLSLGQPPIDEVAA